MDLNLEKKVSLITGASSGIGRSTALLMGIEKSYVCLMARNKDRLRQIAAKIDESGGEALVIVGDVTDPNDCNYAIKKIIQQFGHLDVLVNAAGILAKGTIENTSLQ